jgi:hypothetical protein
VATPSSSDAERGARRSDALAWAVRGGLVGYGVLHLLVAWVAVRLVLTAQGGTVTGRGALAQLADETSGRLTLAVMAVGFAALLVWQLIAAAVGYHAHGRHRRALERSAALCRAVLWGYLAVVTTELAVQGGSAGGSSGGSPSSTTASAMSWPAGAWLVALVGVVLVGVGIGLAVFGWRTGFLDQVDARARSRDRRRVPIVVLGRVGYVTKGLALVVIGVLLVWAAWTHDPHKSGGLDRSLLELVGGGLGRIAVVLIAIGLACYGLFLIARARHLNRDSLTS